jgi:hypothetical protein
MVLPLDVRDELPLGSGTGLELFDDGPGGEPLEAVEPAAIANRGSIVS